MRFYFYKRPWSLLEKILFLLVIVAIAVVTALSIEY